MRVRIVLLELELEFFSLGFRSGSGGISNKFGKERGSGREGTMSGIRVFGVHGGEVLPIGFEASFAFPVGADVGIKLRGLEEVVVSNVIMRAYVTGLEV